MVTWAQGRADDRARLAAPSSVQTDRLFCEFSGVVRCSTRLWSSTPQAPRGGGGRALEQVGVQSVRTRQVERHDAGDHERDAERLSGGERLVQQQHPDDGDRRGSAT
jgi:hypothetical protein